MGHYAAEMMCNKCGNVHCTCPIEKNKPQKGWYITPDFRVITAEEADAQHVKASSQDDAAMGKVKLI